MKKFIISAICILAAAFNAYADTATPATPAPAASAPTIVLTPSVANASVDCKDGKKGSAKAIGDGVYAVAGCGEKPAVKKPVAKKPAKKVESSNSDVVRALAMANVDLKVKASASASAGVTDLTSVPRFAVEGKVYSDAEGNTFERHQGGTRECKFYVNGELVKRQFVQHPDPRESKKQCDLLSQEFYATLTPTTPENGVVYNGGASSVGQTTAPAPSVVSAGNGKHTCELKFNGMVMETTTTADDSSCKAWTQAKAKEKGWVAK
jgi:hypothetical protein